MRTQRECRARGSLALAMCGARACGVAPLRFERERGGGGWRVTVSNLANYYGNVVIGLLCVLPWMSLVWSLCKRPGGHPPAVVMNIVSLMSVTVVLLAEAAAGRSRVNGVIECLAQIQKINSQLNKFGQHISYKKVGTVVTIWTGIGITMQFVDSAMFLYQIAKRSSHYFMEGTFVAYYLQIVVMKLLILQLSLTCLELISSFKHLNVCLRNLQRQIHHEALDMNNSPTSLDISCLGHRSINNVIDSLAFHSDLQKQILSLGNVDILSETVAHLSHLYGCLCEVSSRLLGSHEVTLSSLVLYCLVHLVLAPYALLITAMSVRGGLDVNLWQALLNLYWCVSQAIETIMIVESCHRIHSEISDTKHAISELLLSSQQRALSYQLELFYKLLMTTPADIFKFHRDVLTTMISMSTTYLFMVIQS